MSRLRMRGSFGELGPGDLEMLLLLLRSKADQKIWDAAEEVTYSKPRAVAAIKLCRAVKSPKLEGPAAHTHPHSYHQIWPEQPHCWAAFPATHLIVKIVPST